VLNAEYFRAEGTSESSATCGLLEEIERSCPHPILYDVVLGERRNLVNPRQRQALRVIVLNNI
jgi:hypothetical protein